jgi:predicted AlkP superfamily phosphohydrolase/phosphomutase
LKKNKLLIIGLDCAPPELVFDDFIEFLPNIKRLVENGIYGKLKSSDPPITLPAWMVMATGKSPGELGIYGFRHRKNYSYEDIWIASSLAVKEQTVWDILSEKGKKVCIVGVPPTYPPKKVNGYLISGFLTPDISKKYTYPSDFRYEIKREIGEYIPDVKDFRTDDKDRLIAQIYEMTDKRFELVKYMIKNKDWDFFWFVEMGPDRIHHGLWKFHDKNHHLFEPSSKYKDTIKDYYIHLDKKIGELLNILDKNTKIMIVSDHGAKRMKGCLCINQWLINEGYLKLLEKPERGGSLSKAKIDWKNSKAWGWGGYYARIFLNVKGREMSGTIEPDDYEKFRDDLAYELKNTKGPNGEILNTNVLKPDEIYDKCEGDYPDLMVYFDDLFWRSAGTIGYPSIYLSENDIGPDDAVHSMYGIFIFYDPKKSLGYKIDNLSIFDIAPNILNIMKIKVPNDIKSKIILSSRAK